MLHPDAFEVQMASFSRARRGWQVLDPAIRDEVAVIADLRDGDFVMYGRTDADGPIGPSACARCTWAMTGPIKTRSAPSVASGDRCA